jgi:hypothetical protein
MANYPLKKKSTIEKYKFWKIEKEKGNEHNDKEITNMVSENNIETFVGPFLK